MCASLGFHSVLAEQRSQLSCLTSTYREMKEGHEEFLKDYRTVRAAHTQLLKDIEGLQKEHAALREEHEALRDCLLLTGLLKSGELRARTSLRRAREVLCSLIGAPEFSLSLGCAMGVTAARRLCEVSRAFGGGLRPCLPALSRRMPPDVYVFGGKNDGALALATAERFSPGTGQWEVLPPMRAARYGCAAAAVGGRLYVVGGHDGRRVLASAERFDPMLGYWELLPQMPTARSRCAATAARGRVYVLGGRDGRASVPTAHAERLDPTTGSWQRLESMPLAPVGCTATSLAGIIYVIGVDPNRDMALLRFDPRAGGWEPLQSLPTQRFGCAAARVAGAVYVLGGHDGEQAVATTERLDPVRGVGRRSCAWEPLPSAPTARHGCAATAAGGFLYLLGGDDAQSLAAAERYHPSRRAWEVLPPLPTGRFGCAAAAAWC